MLLASERLATIHVSTHVPLRRACELNTQRILRTIELGHDAMKLLGFDTPRIAVCGLNPHAGEHGLFGEEDERAIAPAIHAAQAAGMCCTGPHAGDTVFLQASRGAYDLVVAMYHDQGHIPMKLIDFEGTVNVSLGHSGHPHLGRPWHRLRHRRQEPRRSAEYEAGDASGRADGRHPPPDPKSSKMNPDSPNRDPRIYLAAERTFLAWLRTSLAMMGFGFVVARFGLFMREIAPARTQRPPAPRVSRSKAERRW